jgi:hypothetical protein
MHILGHRFGLGPGPLNSGTDLMEYDYRGVKYTVVQMAGGAGWKWKVSFDDGKNKSGVAPDRALAIKLAEFEIDRVIKDGK